MLKRSLRDSKFFIRCSRFALRVAALSVAALSVAALTVAALTVGAFTVRALAVRALALPAAGVSVRPLGNLGGSLFENLRLRD